MDPSIQETPVEVADARDHSQPRDQGRQNRRRADRSPRNPRLEPDRQPDSGSERTAPEPGRFTGGRRRGRMAPAGPLPVRCVRSVVAVPATWPVASRTGVATAALVEVDRRDDVRLLCDCLHEGPHFWPDVEPSPPIWDGELDASLASPDGLEPSASAGDVREAPGPAVVDQGDEA